MSTSINTSINHYTPALVYRMRDEPLIYTFEIQEETHLGEYVIINSYTQELTLDLLADFGKEGYQFEIHIDNFNFCLDKSLKPQEKLLDSLAVITQHLTIQTTQEGVIKWVDHKQVVKKWESIKDKLFSTHQGHQAHAYIEGIDTKIRTEDLLIADLKQPRLLGLLFNGYQRAHIADIPKTFKISNLVHCLPVSFKESILDIQEDKGLQEKQIISGGSMEELTETTKERIEKYFNYFGIDTNPVYLSNYSRETILDLRTGYPKSAVLTIELTNGSGYLRRQQFHLKRKNNG